MEKNRLVITPNRTYRIKTRHQKMLADTATPIGIYLRIRDRYRDAVLLESSDYHSNDNSYSFICCEPMARFEVCDGKVLKRFPDGLEERMELEGGHKVSDELAAFTQSFQIEKQNFKFVYNALFGYTAYDANRYFEKIDVAKNEDQYKIPEVLYNVYRYVIVVDHFKNELFAFENYPENDNEKGLDKLLTLISNTNFPRYKFEKDGPESSNFTDEEFLEVLAEAKKHCFRGDVFQMVLSRRFESKFKGDEFNLYRALRSINPSPYLFYFDYGDYKMFGSSPEAQLIIQDGKATINPIAGTFKRSGSDEQDAILARQLHKDPKENSEHVMLVDLARNDLSRGCNEVEVDTYKELQFFSHVIHLVSKVTGKLKAGSNPLALTEATFPAGTLSGAPKHRAMQLINQYEPTRRGIYGGAIGILGFDGSYNHAIIIRSFFSKDNTLYYQAGAGVVAKSEIQSELQEVNNKLGALRKALNLAEQI